MDRADVEKLLVNEAKRTWRDVILWKGFNEYDKCDRVVFRDKDKLQKYARCAKEDDPGRFSPALARFSAVNKITIDAREIVDWIHPVATFIAFPPKGVIDITVDDSRYEIRRFLNCYVKSGERTVMVATQTEISVASGDEVGSVWYPAPFIVDSRDEQFIYPRQFSKLPEILFQAYFVAQYGLLYRPEIMADGAGAGVGDSADTDGSLKPFRKVKAERRVYEFAEPPEEKRKYKRHTGKWSSAGYVNKNGKYVHGCYKGPHRNDPNYPCAPPKEYVIPKTS